VRTVKRRRACGLNGSVSVCRRLETTRQSFSNRCDIVREGTDRQAENCRRPTGPGVLAVCVIIIRCVQTAMSATRCVVLIRDARERYCRMLISRNNKIPTLRLLVALLQRNHRVTHSWEAAMYTVNSGAVDRRNGHRVDHVAQPYGVGQKSKLLYCDRYFKGYTIVLRLNIL